MSKVLMSCAVAHHTKRNYATITPENATSTATNPATIDILALSMQVLERCNATHKATINANNELRYEEINATQQANGFVTHSKQSCAVALHRERNNATTELRRLIKKVSTSYGGDDESFLEEYIDEVIKESSHDLDAAIACFRSLCTD